MKFAVVVSRFNQSVTQKLLAGAQRAFQRRRISAVDVVWVPGAYEIPFAAKMLAQKKKPSAIVCLGCVLKGETDHNRYISEAVAHGILQASLETGVPMTFGVLTPDNLEQARERSQDNSANKGTEAAEAAIEMAELARKGRKNG